jgi:hypothetical protein
MGRQWKQVTVTGQEMDDRHDTKHTIMGVKYPYLICDIDQLTQIEARAVVVLDDHTRLGARRVSF